MESIVINTSVVVLARQHNPSLLHPAFLESQNIVPSDWELQEEPLCTPPFSVVKYKNGVVFTAEQQKFQVLQNEPPGLEGSPVADLAEKYVQALPHVHYTAVGINFSVALPRENPEEALMRGFVKVDALSLESSIPQAVVLRITYHLPDGVVLNLTVSPGKLHRKAETASETPVWILHGNYHHPIEEAHADFRAVTSAIHRFPECCRHFQDVVIPAFNQGD